MKVRTAIRKTVKWGGAVMAVVIFTAWVGSYWWLAGWVSQDGHFIAASSGLLQVGFDGSLQYESPSTGWHAFRLSGQFSLWFKTSNTRPPRWAFAAPLWLPVLLAMLASGIAWRREIVLARRARLGHCPTCGYNRRGLATGAVCPECGAAASAIAPS